MCFQGKLDKKIFKIDDNFDVNDHKIGKKMSSTCPVQVSRYSKRSCPIWTMFTSLTPEWNSTECNDG